MTALGLTGCTVQRASTSELRLVTGNAGGLYDALGTKFAAELTRNGLPTKAMPSPGSIENLIMVAENRADLGLSLADSADVMVRYERRPVAALARMYMNYVHLVVTVASPILNARDLAGKRICVGAEGSGTQLTAQRVLHVLGLAVRVRHMGLDDSLNALEDREIDGLFWSGGVPTPALAKRTNLRLVPLDNVVTQLRRIYSSVYEPASVPAGVYGMARSVPTVGTPTYLICRAGLPDDVVDDVTRILFESRDRLSAPNAPGGVLDKRYAIGTGIVPLHPGAARYYRSVFG